MHCRRARSRRNERAYAPARAPVTVPRAVVLATRSAGKIRELRALFAAHDIAVETLDELGLAEERAEEGIEIFETFAENATAKARWFAARLPGRVVFAEDSGLMVDALHGRPGVHSKRWAGAAGSGAVLDAANNEALARALEGAQDRSARYVCVAVCVDAEAMWQGEGTVEGRIADAPRGVGGFGYDPWFVSAELGLTFGEAASEAKARVSHRVRAVGAVVNVGGAALRARVARCSTQS
jgi:XTP/dITP diphosphohydrolase